MKTYKVTLTEEYNISEKDILFRNLKTNEIVGSDKVNADNCENYIVDITSLFLNGRNTHSHTTWRVADFETKIGKIIKKV